MMPELTARPVQPNVRQSPMAIASKEEDSGRKKVPSDGGTYSKIMGMRSSATALVLLVCLAVPAQSARQVSKTRARTLCVIAVHDSSLFTLCPGDSNRGLAQVAAGAGRRRVPVSGPGFTGSVAVPLHAFPRDGAILDRSRPDWDELARVTKGICRSGFMDPDLQTKVEKEFSRYPGFTLAASPVNAELIFLIEGNYVSGMTFSSDPDGRESAPEARRSFRRLETAVALALPSRIYNEKPADSEALLQGALWRGVAIPVRTLVPGTEGYITNPGQLVTDYVERGKPSIQTPPVCAAWASPPSRPEDARGPGATPAPASKSTAPSLEMPAVDTAIRVNVDMVTVPVVVSDPQGKFLTGLSAQEFQVFEDGREQKIASLIPETEPFHVALALDTSNSTRFRHVEIQMAASEFADALRTQDRLMILSFGEFIAVDSEFTANRENILRAIMQTRVSGGTRLYDAIDLVVKDRFGRLSGRKAIVLFSDGVDTSSRLATLESSLATVEESEVLVYVVHYDTRGGSPQAVVSGTVTDAAPRGSGKADYDLGAEYLLNLTRQSGGRLYPAGSIADVRQAFGQIAGELRHQYTLCYYPDRSGDETSFRRIRVTVNRPDARIRARNGYRTAR
jgi:Ca-activated chloride channel homolog